MHFEEMSSRLSHIFLKTLKKKRMKISLTLSSFLLGALVPTFVEGGYPNPHVCETDDSPGIKCNTSVSC